MKQKSIHSTCNAVLFEIIFPYSLHKGKSKGDEHAFYFLPREVVFLLADPFAGVTVFTEGFEAS